MEQLKINFLLYKNYFIKLNYTSYIMDHNINISLKSIHKLSNHYIFALLNELCDINDINKITYEKIYTIKDTQIYNTSNIKEESYNYYICFNKTISCNTNKFLNYLFLIKNFHLYNINISSNNYKMNRPNHSVF